MGIKEKYKKVIANALNTSPGNVYLFWKGRVALFTLLKAMEVKPGDEIILPGFTCVVVPNAIKYLDAIPVYVDIKKDTLNPDFDQVVSAITDKTKVIIVQNTFGLSSDVDKISEYAVGHGIFTIEDCTHGFGGMFKGKPNGSYCDAAFFSTQWNKPFSTGIGGFAAVNNNKLLEKVTRLEEDLIHPSLFDELRLLLLNIAYRIFLHPWSYWLVRDIYRFLSRHGIVIGSSDTAELTSVMIPEKYFKSVGAVQAKLGTTGIKRIDEKLIERKENAARYTAFLAEQEKNHVRNEYFSNHSFLKYPLMVKDRNAFRTEALKNHIPLGDWFVSPIHPVLENYQLWGINLTTIPVANEVSSQIVNLPTEDTDIRKVLKFLKSELDLII